MTLGLVSCEQLLRQAASSGQAASLDTGLGVASIALSLALAAGAWDRAAAVGLLLLALHRVPSDPGAWNLSAACLAWLLIVHVLAPSAPYGSWAAHGRADPGGGWRMPSHLYLASWLVLAAGHIGNAVGYLASESLGDGGRFVSFVELALASLIVFRRLRPWVWSGLLVLQTALLVELGCGCASAGLLLIQMWTFDPAWLPPRADEGKDVLFYDGACGLCHRFVRLVLAEDAGGGATLGFAPLQGSTFASTFSQEERASLPDSLVVRTADGRTLVRSRAVRRVLDRMGGLWRLAAMAGAVIPTGLADTLYDGVARIRSRLFTRPHEACPLVAAELRARFLP
jgi:predicted DCC family thiol-disulfide oxidoreductase YuxK